MSKTYSMDRTNREPQIPSAGDCLSRKCCISRLDATLITLRREQSQLPKRRVYQTTDNVQHNSSVRVMPHLPQRSFLPYWYTNLP
jgi:hypothetical protein